MMMVHVADQQGHLANFASQIIERLQAFGHKLRFEDKVPRWITDQGEFGRDYQFRTRFEAFPVSCEDSFYVVGKISDDGIDLGEADIHKQLQKTPALLASKIKN